MKRLTIAALALPFTFAVAFGQGIHIGPDGVGIDTGRDRDRMVREYQDDDGCMVRVMRHRSPDGDIVTNRIRDCD
jgi:hypothetical protein